MTLTKEEIQDLERQRCESKMRCRECWDTLQQLNKIAKTYLETWRRWDRRAEEADKKLAEVDGRLHKVEKAKKSKVESLTRAQILAIAEELDKDGD